MGKKQGSKSGRKMEDSKEQKLIKLKATQYFVHFIRLRTVTFNRSFCFINLEKLRFS